MSQIYKPNSNYYQLPNNNNNYKQLPSTQPTSTSTTTDHNNPPNQKHTQNLNYTTRVLPQPHRPTPPPPPNQIANNIQTTTTNNINILQLNIDGMNTKIHKLTDLLNKRTIHIAMLQEQCSITI